MLRYLYFSTLLLMVLLLGIVESAVALPLFSVGVLLHLVRKQVWWVRLSALVLAGVVWGTAQMSSPSLLVLLLLTGTWFDSWLRTKVLQRASLFWTSLALAIAVGVVRGVPFWEMAFVVLLVQSWLFWLFTRALVVTSRPIALQFFVPPRALNDAKKHT